MAAGAGQAAGVHGDLAGHVVAGDGIVKSGRARLQGIAVDRAAGGDGADQCALADGVVAAEVGETVVVFIRAAQFADRFDAAVAARL